MSAEPTPLDAHLTDRLQASLALIGSEDLPDETDPGWAAVAAGLTAAFAVLAPPTPAVVFELEHIALLEAIIEWDPDDAMRLITDRAVWARLDWYVQKARKALDNAEDRLARALAGVCERKMKHSFEGIPVFEVKGESKGERWDTEALHPLILRAIAEQRTLPCEACGGRLGVHEIERVLAAYTEARSFDSRWKTGREATDTAPAEGGIRGYGFDPKDFRTHTRSAPTIVFAEPIVPTVPSEEVTVERRGPIKEITPDP
jgi:hypothetical protein